MAFVDVPNLFALPQPNMDELVPVEEMDKYTKQEYTTRLMEASQILTYFLAAEGLVCVHVRDISLNVHSTFQHSEHVHLIVFNCICTCTG